MVVLREMRKEEFAAYCQYFVDDYSQEIAVNYGHPMKLAIDLAKKELNRSFPNGLESNEHSLLCIDTKSGGKSKLVGYLWHSIKVEDSSTFIYDFFVFPEYRGEGVGTDAILELEKQLKAKGINQIKLRVAYHNERALKLYKEVGFIVTGYSMSKSIVLS